jgi:hypothetical protein
MSVCALANTTRRLVFCTRQTLGGRNNNRSRAVCGDDLGRRLEYLNFSDVVGLARCIADGRVFGFGWREVF